jgi:hypothetical protein
MSTQWQPVFWRRMWSQSPRRHAHQKAPELGNGQNNRHIQRQQQSRFCTLKGLCNYVSYFQYVPPTCRNTMTIWRVSKGACVR